MAHDNKGGGGGEAKRYILQPSRLRVRPYKNKCSQNLRKLNPHYKRKETKRGLAPRHLNNEADAALPPTEPRRARNHFCPRLERVRSERERLHRSSR